MVRGMLAMMIAVTLPLFAQETFTHEDSGLSFTLPGGWTYTQEGDHFEAASEDDEVSLLFFVGQGNDVPEMIDAIMDELADIIQKPGVSEEYNEEKINGLTQVYVEGDGYIEGERIDWDLTLVLGSDSAMVIVALGEIERFQGMMDRIYNSIRE